jgi:aminotransferase
MKVPSHIAGIMSPVIDVVKERAAYWRRQGRDIVNLGQAVPGFPPPQAAIQAAQRALEEPDTHSYSADAGILPLRKALADGLAKHCRALIDPKSEIIITAGANQAFVLALITILEPGDEVILPSPFFMNHEMAVRAVGAIPVEAPLSEHDGFDLRLEGILPFVTPKTRAVVIVSPSNPTGAVCEPGELERITLEMLARGVYVISDETYIHFVYDEAKHLRLNAIPEWREGVITVGSFSKSFAMPGWRVGYLIAPSEIIWEAMKLQDTMIICAPVIAQKAVLAALNECWDYPAPYLPELDRRRKYVHERIAAMPGMSWYPTKGGFFALVRVEGCTDSERLCMELLDKVQVVTIPGSAFGKAGEGFLRFSYGAADIHALAKAFDRLTNKKVRSSVLDLL